jgi:site-specific DNA-methyltransferase (adenine-specific)
MDIAHENKMSHRLYFGDNLPVLRTFPAESVDLIYLDPPFNSAANYNVLFKTQKGHESTAQIEAFEDTWHWNSQAEIEFKEIVLFSNPEVSEMMQALRKFLGANDMMAYLVMMANRLFELRRVLRPTGSLYLHCDPTASHYLKIVLDGIFGKENFRNEIIWQRTSSHNRAKRWGPIHDTIFFYSKTDDFVWNRVVQELDAEYVKKFYRFKDDKGQYRSDNLTGPGVRFGDSGQVWKGIDPTEKKRHWEPPPDRALPEWFVFPEGYAEKSVTERLDVLDEQGLIFWPQKTSGVPGFKRYMLETSGAVIQDIVTDIPPLSPHAAEKIGYPTQKPVALLERIIQASSNEGDTVLDPFCGCGTAVHAAQKLKRQWIGIDITHLAITLIEKRMQEAFPGIVFDVHGTPKDLAGARDLALRDKYQFQWWALSLVNAQPFQGRKKGADGGIDGLIYFSEDGEAFSKAIVSVKGGGNVNVAMVRDLAHVVAREKAAIGLFVTLEAPTRPMRTEAIQEGFYRHPLTGREFAKIQILSIKGLLDGTEKASHPDSSGITFKKIKAEDKVIEQKTLLF